MTAKKSLNTVPVDAKIYTDTSFDAWGALFGKFETADIQNKQMLKLHKNVFEHYELR